ncbi:MAG: fructose-bisphosphate aldolase class I [Alphaproteobacteria bacterium]|nr:fructose-bisphosphate aldolase class I [Alphaproteobacteria bacterium]
MELALLSQTARALVADGKGILAADESTGTIKKRFDQIGVSSTVETRRDYRHLMFSAGGAASFISGVILFDETLRQQGPDGVPLVDVLNAAGMIPGIKVDTGAKPLALHPEETVTEGLDGLRERLDEYRSLGAKFTKWRAVYRIGKDMPSRACLAANAHALARYAALAQEAGLVPIVEPEVLMDGPHSIERCEEVTSDALHTTFAALAEQGVGFEGMLLKPNMVLSGTEASERAGVEQVAMRTLACLRRCVPAAVPGIVFLSGGQSSEEATMHLNAMNKLEGPKPWKLSFSYGRALQADALKAWGGDNGNLEAAQAVFLQRARANGLASLGTYA